MRLKDEELKNLDYLTSLLEYENREQVKKWGIQERHIFEWAMWTTEEFGEFIQAINEYNYRRTEGIDSVLHEGIQTVTLILKIIDSLLVQEEEQ